jgi:hypothetical protein
MLKFIPAKRKRSPHFPMFISTGFSKASCRKERMESKRTKRYKKTKKAMKRTRERNVA